MYSTILKSIIIISSFSTLNLKNLLKAEKAFFAMAFFLTFEKKIFFFAQLIEDMANVYMLLTIILSIHSLSLVLFYTC